MISEHVGSKIRIHQSNTDRGEERWTKMNMVKSKINVFSTDLTETKGEDTQNQNVFFDTSVNIDSVFVTIWKFQRQEIVACFIVIID